MGFQPAGGDPPLGGWHGRLTSPQSAAIRLGNLARAMLVPAAMMHRAFPSALARFTAADVAFLESVLSPDGTSAAIRQLAQDPTCLAGLLDLPRVHQALLEKPAAVAVSTGFYFHVLTRHAFLRAGIDDRELTDYVAGVLAEKAVMAPDSRAGSPPAWLTHVVDFISIIDSTGGALRFHLLVEAGNQFLTLTGIFPGFLEERSRRKGAPGLGFYEDFARQSYRLASESRQAPDGTPRVLLARLAELLPAARRSLNQMSRNVLFLDS